LSAPFRTRAAAAIGALAVLAAACGAEADPTDAFGAADPPTTEIAAEVQVVATTSILGDVVRQLVGTDGEVTVLMGPGVDPHAYQPSARDAGLLREADLVVANGLQLEESLVSVLDAAAADGVRIFELAPQVDPIAYT
jgi:zinc/manganese transport system substrate-binding protein